MLRTFVSQAVSKYTNKYYIIVKCCNIFYYKINLVECQLVIK